MRQPVVAATGAVYDFAAFTTACRNPSQRLWSLAEIFLNGTLLTRHGQLKVTGGSVTVDRRATHRGRVSGLTFAEPSLVPTVEGGVLSPAGYEVRVWRGVNITGVGSVGCSLGVFGIEDAKVDGNTGVTTIDGWDRSKRVDDANLTDVLAWVSGGALETYLSALVFDRVPWVGEQVAYSIEGANHFTQGVNHERGSSPWTDIIEASASAVGYETFFDGDGIWRWRPEPDFRNADPICDLHESDGTTPGVLLQLDPAYSRSNSHNQWQVMSETSNDGTEYVGTAIDDDPYSLTYYYGDFGKRPAPIERVKTIQSQADADAAAYARKAANLGLARAIDFSFVPNPALEPGDAVSLRRGKASIDEVALIDELTIGLGPTDPMTGQVRAKQDLT